MKWNDGGDDALTPRNEYSYDEDDEEILFQILFNVSPITNTSQTRNY
jgi:hypothetical protein